MSTTNDIMSMAQEYASAWSLVGSRFDNGHGMECADEARAALLKAVESLSADAARFAWVLPILSGGDDDLANTRALSLATQFLYGTSTRNAIDAAMKENECPTFMGEPVWREKS